MMKRSFKYVMLLNFVLAPLMPRAQSFDKLSSIQLNTVDAKPATLKIDKKFMVLFFLGTDCPISQKYMHRIEEIRNQFRSDFDFIAIIPGQFTNEEIKAFKTEYKSPLTFYRDGQLELAHYLHATVTPEVFVFDKFDLKYKGAIDNWFYELGKNRRVTTEQYLVDALTAIADGKTPDVVETKSIGCFIQMPADMEHHH